MLAVAAAASLVAIIMGDTAGAQNPPARGMRWTKAAPFPEPEEELYGTVINGKFYVVGGFGFNPPGGPPPNAGRGGAPGAPAANAGRVFKHQINQGRNVCRLPCVISVQSRTWSGDIRHKASWLTQLQMSWGKA